MGIACPGALLPARTGSRDQKTHKHGLSMGSVFNDDCRERTACPCGDAGDQTPLVHMQNGALYDHTKLVALLSQAPHGEDHGDVGLG